MLIATLDLVINTMASMMVMGIASRLCGAWALRYNRTYLEYVGRMLFWGGGMFTVARLHHMPVISAVALIPIGLTCEMIPPFTRLRGSEITVVVFNSLRLISLSLISFIPLMFLLWIYDYSWFLMIWAATLMPLSYWIGRVAHCNLWQLSNGPKMMEFVIGNTVGLCFSLALILQLTTPVPALPEVLLQLKYALRH